MPTDDVDYVAPIIKTNMHVPVIPSARADELLLEKIHRATDKNVEIQKRTMNFGTRWEYRLYCTRCKQENMVKDNKIFLSHTNIDDDIVVFCIKHRHDGGGNAMKVLSVFSDPQEQEEVEGGRMFREEDE